MAEGQIEYGELERETSAKVVIKSVLRICIGFNADPDPRFADQKFQHFTAEKILFHIQRIKIDDYLSIAPTQDGKPTEALKIENPAIQNMKFFHLFLFVGHFALLDPDPVDQNQHGSMRIRIRSGEETELPLSYPVRPPVKASVKKMALGSPLPAWTEQGLTGMSGSGSDMGLRLAADWALCSRMVKNTSLCFSMVANTCTGSHIVDFIILYLS